MYSLGVSSTLFLKICFTIVFRSFSSRWTSDSTRNPNVLLFLKICESMRLIFRQHGIHKSKGKKTVHLVLHECSRMETDELSLLVITWLLQHEPQKRPTAYELSQSLLVPPRMEEEYFKGVLRLMGESSSTYISRMLTHGELKQNQSHSITKLFSRRCSSNLLALLVLSYTI